MSRRSAGSVGLLAAIASAAIAMFVVRVAKGDPYEPAIATRVLAATCRVVALGIGIRSALRCARAMGEDNRARAPWVLVAAWLVAFLVAVLVLTAYDFAFAGHTPFPTPADLFFCSGYVALFAALVLFVRAYHASGFDVGSARGHGTLAALAAAVLAVGGAFLLAPIAASPKPRAARLTSLAYPSLDLCVLVPTLVLLRITTRFRGGGVWKVWATLLAAVTCMSLGDIAFAFIVTSASTSVPTAALDLFEIVTYATAAYALVIQDEMVASGDV